MTIVAYVSFPIGWILFEQLFLLLLNNLLQLVIPIGQIFNIFQKHLGNNRFILFFHNLISFVFDPINTAIAIHFYRASVSILDILRWIITLFIQNIITHQLVYFVVALMFLSFQLKILILRCLFLTILNIHLIN